jgi:hypothetical protein
VVRIDFHACRYVSHYRQLHYKLTGITAVIRVNCQSAKLMFVRDTHNPGIPVCEIDYISKASRINVTFIICEYYLYHANKLFIF